ncbi:MAG: pteridine reductase [Gammaproteobacteria bacterium]|jgi:pteridine reductase
MTDHKVVLITGAAHRIGATTARYLHAAGCNIILHYLSSRSPAQALQQELNAQRENSVVLVQADLLANNALNALVKEAHNAWQRLDVLVNNASTFYRTPIGSANDQHWNDLFGTNVKAPFFLAQAAAPFLRKHHGCIINMVDIHARRPLKEYSIYSMAKAALETMTKALARELGPEIRVNGVAPGAILWPDDIDEVTKQRIVSKTFLKRKGEPEDIAKAIRFIIEDAPYMTGQILSIDGGRSLSG